MTAAASEALERQKRPRYLDKARTEDRVLYILPRLVYIRYRVKLRCVAHAETGYLREDVPHPMAALASCAYLAQRRVVGMLLRNEKSFKRIVHDVHLEKILGIMSARRLLPY